MTWRVAAIAMMLFLGCHGDSPPTLTTAHDGDVCGLPSPQPTPIALYLQSVDCNRAAEACCQLILTDDGEAIARIECHYYATVSDVPNYVPNVMLAWDLS